MATRCERRHNLPVQLTSFVGREIELDAVARLLGEHRLVTLTGAGGIGKTRLAIEAAAAVDAPHGVWAVELASVADPAQVPGEVAAASGLVPPRGASAERALLSALVDWSAGNTRTDSPPARGRPTWSRRAARQPVPPRGAATRSRMRSE